jgi:hypothetical protein
MKFTLEVALDPFADDWLDTLIFVFAQLIDRIEAAGAEHDPGRLFGLALRATDGFGRRIAIATVTAT